MADDEKTRARRNRERIADARLMAEYAVYKGRDTAHALESIATCEANLTADTTGDDLLRIISELGKSIAPATFEDLDSGRLSIRFRKEANCVKITYIFLSIAILVATLFYTAKYFTFTLAQDEMKGISNQNFVEMIDTNVSLFKKIAIRNDVTVDVEKIATGRQKDQEDIILKEYSNRSRELRRTFQQITITEANIRNAAESYLLANISCSEDSFLFYLRYFLCANSYSAHLKESGNYESRCDPVRYPDEPYRIADAAPLRAAGLERIVPDRDQKARPPISVAIAPGDVPAFQRRLDYEELLVTCSDPVFNSVECKNAYLAYVGLPALTLNSDLDARVVTASNYARAYAALLGSFILPLFYGLLGAIILHLRMFLDPNVPDPDFWSVSVRSVLGAFAAVLLLAIGGPSIQSITTGSGAIIGSFGLAFVIGYSVDVFFSFLEKLIGAFSAAQKTEPKPGG